MAGIVKADILLPMQSVAAGMYAWGAWGISEEESGTVQKFKKEKI